MRFALRVKPVFTIAAMLAPALEEELLGSCGDPRYILFLEDKEQLALIEMI